MKNRSSSDKYQLVTEINMIPFIDVSLVLLIIFMVLTPFLVKEQIKIDLPHTKSVNSPVDERRIVQVDVTRDGSIYVDGELVKEDDVYDAIHTRLTDPETQPVVIAADRDVSFEHVVVVMDAAKRCGAKRLGVSAKHDGPAHGAPGDVAEPKSKGGSGDAKHRSSAAPDSTKRRASASSDSKSHTSGTSGDSKSRTSKRATRPTDR
jgi:biopolymer transport protein ExbD